MADIWRDLTDSFNDDMAIQEMSKKYLNTYLVLLTPQGKQNVIYYQGFHGDRHCFSDDLGVGLKFNINTEQKIVCKFPERRLFNYSGYALEFIRKPNRQYRRGICKDNCTIYNPIASVWGVGTNVFGAKVLTAALEPTYPESTVEAINALNKQEVVSIALNEQFFLSQNITKTPNRHYLWYCNRVIGYFDTDKNVFFIKHPQFKQEVLDNINLFKPFKLEF